VSGVSPCPSCGGHSLYRGPETSSGGGHAPNYLPGLGEWWRAARFSLVVCRDCGLTRFFASPAARRKLSESDKWKSV
jgi:predicted nucleic-acid-binding Zn-ribbon protein